MSDMLGHYDIIYDTIRHFLHATTNSIISDIPSDINDYECTTEGFYNDVCRLLSLSVFFLSVPGFRISTTHDHIVLSTLV